MENTLTQERRQDLFDTSTHTVHNWRPCYYFPSTNFKVLIHLFVNLIKKKYIFQFKFL